MKKRDFLRTGSAAAAACLWPWAGLAHGAAGAASSHTLAAAWRQQDAPGGGTRDCVGLLRLDWEGAQVQVKSALEVPTRAHDLLAQPDGGFVAVAFRPGTWLVRCDAQGRAVQWHSMERESEGRTLDGHACASADGQWLYTTETNPHSGQGWISVRDRRNLQKVAQWRTFGVEPHQVLLDPSGALMVANGGILRGQGDQKRDLHRMDPSLVRLDPRNGERLGQWRLKDPRLGIRHMAWSTPQGAGASPLLGIALQNEHDDVALRRNAPVLAVWDGQGVQTPCADARGGGYSGDIVAGPEGGFVLSCLRTNMALHWSPSAPADVQVVAQLREVGALAPLAPQGQAEGVLLAAASGVGRWHPAMPAVFMPWPGGMAPDNHWVLLG